MRIWGERPRVEGIQGSNKNVGRVNSVPHIENKKDEVSISDRAKDYQIVMKALKNIPDIRNDKVDEIVKRYDSSTYNVNGNIVADKIIKSVIDKRV